MKLFEYGRQIYIGVSFKIANDGLVGLVKGNDLMIVDRADVSELNEINDIKFAICTNNIVEGGTFEVGEVYQILNVYGDGLVEVLDKYNTLSYSDLFHFEMLD